MIPYQELRPALTTGSVVGSLSEGESPWCGIVVRVEDIITALGPLICGCEALAGRIMVLYHPWAPEVHPARLMSHVVDSATETLVRIVEDQPTVESIIGVVNAAALYFETRFAHTELTAERLVQGLTTACPEWRPKDGGALAATVWQHMGYMLPAPHGPAPADIIARQMLDPLWGPPQIVGIEYGNPITIATEGSEAA